MKRFLTELGAAAIMLFALTNVHAQNQSDCTIEGSCDPYIVPVVETLVVHDCYEDSDCTAPNCPGFKCADEYALYFQDGPDTPCGYIYCYYCAQCASGNCPPGTHVAFGKEKTRAKAILAAIRARRARVNS